MTGATTGEPANDGPGSAVDGPGSMDGPGSSMDGPGSPVDGSDQLADQPGSPVPQPSPSERPTALRLSRVHLRMGLQGLARAELEAMAGRGTLDEAGLGDLAEVRWRTGDLAGAGQAAEALVERGSKGALVLIIAAEAVAALGRPAEARRLAARALETADVPIGALYAGMPRSRIWPDAPGAGAANVRLSDEVAAPAERTADPAVATEVYERGLSALGDGDVSTAAARLGVALRLDATSAQRVLDAISDRTADPILALVRGDALRLLGRETEAMAAFDVAAGAASRSPDAGHAASPADSAASPADSAASPADSAASPADSAASPADSAASPADSAASPADSAASPADSAASPADSAASLADSAASLADDASPVDDHSAGDDAGAGDAQA